MAGQRLYADFFEFLPPLSFVITKVWLSAFGMSLLAARWLAAVTVTGICAVTFMACLRAGVAAPLVAASLTAWVLMSQGDWTQVNHHWFATLFCGRCCLDGAVQRSGRAGPNVEVRARRAGCRGGRDGDADPRGADRNRLCDRVPQRPPSAAGGPGLPGRRGGAAVVVPGPGDRGRYACGGLCRRDRVHGQAVCHNPIGTVRQLDRREKLPPVLVYPICAAAVAWCPRDGTRVCATPCSGPVSPSRPPGSPGVSTSRCLPHLFRAAAGVAAASGLPEPTDRRNGQRRPGASRPCARCLPSRRPFCSMAHTPPSLHPCRGFRHSWKR